MISWAVDIQRIARFCYFCFHCESKITKCIENGRKRLCKHIQNTIEIPRCFEGTPNYLTRGWHVKTCMLHVISCMLHVNPKIDQKTCMLHVNFMYVLRVRGWCYFLIKSTKRAWSRFRVSKFLRNDFKPILWDVQVAVPPEVPDQAANVGVRPLICHTHAFKNSLAV